MLVPLEIKKGSGRGRIGVYSCPHCKTVFERIACVVNRNNRMGKTQACGCMNGKASKHGEHQSPIYWAYRSMKARCNNKNNKSYHRYGGRGIQVCAEWSKYEAFASWSKSNGHAVGLTIDRIDNNGDYKPSNCRWVTQKENSQNTSMVKLCQSDVHVIRSLYFGGWPQPELAKVFQVDSSTVSRVVCFKYWS